MEDTYDNEDISEEEDDQESLVSIHNVSNTNFIDNNINNTTLIDNNTSLIDNTTLIDNTSLIDRNIKISSSQNNSQRKEIKISQPDKREKRDQMNKVSIIDMDIDLELEKERKKLIKTQQRKEEAAAIAADLIPYDLVSLESSILHSFIESDCIGPYIQVRNFILKHWFDNV